MLLGYVLAAQAASAQVVSTTELKRMSLAELLQQEVLLVSRTPQHLDRAASAVQVISGSEIMSSGATRLPEALRLATNLQVTQVDATNWAISTRGFNSVLANKLLVMIDGRTIYSPLFAGVFWDMQDVMLEDVELIEVVSGPGGALWGANAVNGVINVRTRSARETQGLHVTAAGGNQLNASTSARYGGALGPDAWFRVYGKFAQREGTLRSAGGGTEDDWRREQGGFRLDWGATPDDTLTLQGDVFRNLIPTATADTIARGGNLTGRWRHVTADGSELRLQAYYSRVHRNLPGSYHDRLDTYDLDFQHRVQLGAEDEHEIVWGADYRFMKDNFQPGRIIMLPPRLELERMGAFVQDTIALAEDGPHLTLGARLEHNDYTDWEIQPSGRIAWQRDPQTTLWAGVSRAVRTPSRLDRDRYFPNASAGSPRFESENLVAWEAGARFRHGDAMSLAAALFYHDYDDIRSTEPAPPDAPLPRELRNGQKGRSYGAELTANVEASRWWRLHAGITEMRVIVEPKPWSTDTSFGALESVDSNHYYSLRSTWNPTDNWEIWANVRYASRITNPFADVPAFTEVDARLAWRPRDDWELAITGQNLLHDRHREYGDPTKHFEVGRSVYVMVRWDY